MTTEEIEDASAVDEELEYMQTSPTVQTSQR